MKKAGKKYLSIVLVLFLLLILCALLGCQQPPKYATGDLVRAPDRFFDIQYNLPVTIEGVIVKPEIAPYNQWGYYVLVIREYNELFVYPFDHAFTEWCYKNQLEPIHDE